MRKSTKSCLVDVNVWLALVYEGHVHNPIARRWLNTLDGEHALFCRLTQLGLLRLLTNRKVMGPDVLGQAAAWRIYDNTIEDPRVGFLREPANIDWNLRRLTKASTPSAGIWTDAYLAALSLEANLRLVTMDRGLRSFSGVDVFFLGPSPTG